MLTEKKKIDPESQFSLGCDLGKLSDPTALCLIERITQRTETRRKTFAGGVFAGWDKTIERGDVAFHVRYLERFPLGTPYPEQVARIVEVFSAPELHDTGRPPVLVVDATGVGRPVVDMLQEAGLQPRAVYITAGHEATRDGRTYRVPKVELVSTVQAHLSSGRLRFAEDLKLANELREEMQNFTAKFTERTGHASFEHLRESDTDDLVVALSLALWMASQHTGGRAYDIN